jgi:hypothetical protein
MREVYHPPNRLQKPEMKEPFNAPVHARFDHHHGGDGIDADPLPSAALGEDSAA